MANKVLEKMFQEAYQMHSDAIFRFVLFKIDNREKALDLTQETFMKTWMHLIKNTDIKNLRAFLYRVAGNLVIDEYRKRGKKDYATDSLEVMSEDGFEPSSNINELEALTNRLDGEKVMSMISSLPEMYSSILFLKYSEDLSISEMAEDLEVSQNVVSVRLNRAMAKLRELIELESKEFQK